MTLQRFVTWSVCLTCGLAVGCSTMSGATPGAAGRNQSLRQASTRVATATDKFDTFGTLVTTAASETFVDSGPTRAINSPTEPIQHDTSAPAALAAPRVRCLNCSDDLERLPREFLCDLESIGTRENMLVLLAAGGASFALHETLDNDVADNVRRHANRWGKGGDFFGGVGNPGHHFAAIGGLYLYSVCAQDVETHELCKSLFDAVSITGLSTILLKATVGTNTRAPNHEPDPFGGAWPSGHTSSSFAFAAVLDEYYGPRVGIPAYLLAGLVGWERLDDGEHDLSDVVFGAALGYVIGKTVAGEHHARFCGMELQPLVDPVAGTSGVAVERRF